MSATSVLSGAHLSVEVDAGMLDAVQVVKEDAAEAVANFYVEHPELFQLDDAALQDGPPKNIVRRSGVALAKWAGNSVLGAVQTPFNLGASLIGWFGKKAAPYVSDKRKKTTQGFIDKIALRREATSDEVFQAIEKSLDHNEWEKVANILIPSEKRTTPQEHINTVKKWIKTTLEDNEHEEPETAEEARGKALEGTAPGWKWGLNLLFSEGLPARKMSTIIELGRAGRIDTEQALSKDEVKHWLRQGIPLPCKRPMKIAYVEPGEQTVKISEKEYRQEHAVPLKVHSSNRNFAMFCAALHLDKGAMEGALDKKGAVVILDMQGSRFQEFRQEIVNDLTITSASLEKKKDKLIISPPDPENPNKEMDGMYEEIVRLAESKGYRSGDLIPFNHAKGSYFIPPKNGMGTPLPVDLNSVTQTSREALEDLQTRYPIRGFALQPFSEALYGIDHDDNITLGTKGQKIFEKLKNRKSSGMLRFHSNNQALATVLNEHMDTQDLETGVAQLSMKTIAEDCVLKTDGIEESLNTFGKVAVGVGVTSYGIEKGFSAPNDVAKDFKSAGYYLNVALNGGAETVATVVNRPEMARRDFETRTGMPVDEEALYGPGAQNATGFERFKRAFKLGVRGKGDGVAGDQVGGATQAALGASLISTLVSFGTQNLIRRSIFRRGREEYRTSFGLQRRGYRLGWTTNPRCLITN